SSATSSVARAAYTMLFRCEVKSLLIAFVESFCCHHNRMSLLPCQWMRIIGTSRTLTSAKCKLFPNRSKTKQETVFSTLNIQKMDIT
ncbi:hypothetical protein, partial [Pectobacterium polaris]|uniref:hypothetical protein n=2 Tax=Pectobacterium polaris TaxID=2042057 RepID=UPI001A9C95C5